MKRLPAFFLSALFCMTAACLSPAPYADEGESCDPNNIPCSTGLECVRGFCIPEDVDSMPGADAGAPASDAGMMESDGSNNIDLPCDGVCSDEQVCDTETQTCVACLEDEDCPEGRCTDENTCVGCEQNADCSTGICDTDSSICVECLLDADCDEGVCSENTCVQCVDNPNCTLADASQCDTQTNTCVACSALEHCAHLSGEGNGVCDVSNAECVECVDVEGGRDACAGASCDPATNECTSTPLESLTVCQTCVSSSECGAGLTCARTKFAGQPRDVFHCVPLNTDGCPDRVFIDAQMAPTPDGAMAEICSPPPLTTCEGYLDRSSNESCGVAEDCGTSMNDGVCRDVGRCTYPCSLVSHCALGDTCVDALSGSGYCAPQ